MRPAGFGNATYLFGGGTSAGSSADIVRVLASGRTSPAGTLPLPISDAAAATVGNTATVVGGFTGTRPVRIDLSGLSPGFEGLARSRNSPPPSATRPSPPSGRLLVASGTDWHHGRKRAIFSFDPLGGGVRRLGDSQPFRPRGRCFPRRSPAGGGRAAHPPLPPPEATPLSPGRSPGGSPHPRPRSRSSPPPHPFLLPGSPPPPPPPAPALSPPPTTSTRPTVRGCSAPVRQGLPPRVYVPNSESNTVDVIDPRTYKVIDHFAVGRAAPARRPLV